MMKRLFSLSVLAFLMSCGSGDEHPGLGKTDSLLVTPLVEPQIEGHAEPDSSALYVDSSMLRQQHDMDILKGLTPKQVLDVYESYRPLRNGRTTQRSLDSFLSAKKINLTELHSVLAEGDRLGWSGAASH